MNVPILVVEDRRSLAEMVAETLRRAGFEATVVLRGDEAIRLIASGAAFAAVVTDLKLPGADGLEVLRASRVTDPRRPVFLMTGHATVETAVSALKSGARDYFVKPVDMDRLIAALRAAQADIGPALDAADLVEMVGSSPRFTTALNALRRVAPTDAAVLLVGPSGSGKELFARAVHDLSPRSSRPFVAFNCAAVPDTLVESELFGHERGAFTGASARHLGRFEQAAGGTLFLDEIGEVPPAAQSKLLRVLEEHHVSRLGGEGEVTVDVRIVAATNRDLRAAVADGTFRRDLFHRLNVFPIELPALAERREDIAALASHLLRRAELRHGTPPRHLSRAATAALALAPWPGNVRELANVLERATILTGAVPTIGVEDLDLPYAACLAALDDGAARAVAESLAGADLDELAGTLADLAEGRGDGGSDL